MKKEWRIAALGDSLTYGYGVLSHVAYPSRLAAELPQLRPQSAWRIYNRGVNGDTSREALLRLEGGVLRLQPHIAVILLGSNDSALNEGQYRTLWEYEQNLSRILTCLLAATHERSDFHGGCCRPVLVTPPPVVDTDFYPFTTTDRIEGYRQVVLQLAERYHCPVIDLFPLFLRRKERSEQAYEDLFQYDGVHWSNQGYDVFYDCIMQMLLELTDAAESKDTK